MFERKMRNHYTTQKDIYDRLNDTVLLFKGEPHYIQTNGVSFCGYPLDDYQIKNTKIDIDPSDPELDISAIEIGYVNIEPGCRLNGNKVGMSVYYRSHPTKQYHQGIQPSRMEVESPIDGRRLEFCPSTMGLPLAKAIREEFPTVHEAIWGINSGLWSSCAISKDVCLVGEKSGLMTVAIRRENIGSLIPGQNKVLVKDNEFVWVIQRLLSRFSISIDPFEGMKEQG